MFAPYMCSVGPEWIYRHNSRFAQDSQSLVSISQDVQCFSLGHPHTHIYFISWYFWTVTGTMLLAGARTREFWRPGILHEMKWIPTSRMCGSTLTTASWRVHTTLHTRWVFITLLHFQSTKVQSELEMALMPHVFENLQNSVSFTDTMDIIFLYTFIDYRLCYKL